MIKITKFKKLLNNNANGEQLQVVDSNLYYSHMGHFIILLKKANMVNIIKYLKDCKYPRINNDLRPTKFYNNDNIKNIFEKTTENFRNRWAKNTKVEFMLKDNTKSKKVTIFNLDGDIRMFNSEYISIFKDNKVFYFTDKNKTLLIITDKFFDPVAVVCPYSNIKNDAIKKAILDRLEFS